MVTVETASPARSLAMTRLTAEEQAMTVAVLGIAAEEGASGVAAAKASEALNLVEAAVVGLACRCFQCAGPPAAAQYSN